MDMSEKAVYRMTSGGGVQLVGLGLLCRAIRFHFFSVSIPSCHDFMRRIKRYHQRDGHVFAILSFDSLVLRSWLRKEIVSLGRMLIRP